MIQILEKGFAFQGERDKYIINKPLEVGEEAARYSCRSISGSSFRLVQYGDSSMMSADRRSRFLQAAQGNAKLPLADHGRVRGQEFDLIPDIGSPVGSRNVGLEEVIRYIIPQLNRNIGAMHDNGLLLRTVSTKDIYYDTDSHRCWIENYAWLLERNSNEAGQSPAPEGVQPCYVPTECRKGGWSVEADYYSLGIALLRMVKGEGIFDGMSEEELAEQLAKGMLPGIDTAAFASIPYHMLSMEQKVFYLITGLTLPDPAERWGFAETRCWFAGQEIPIRQSGGRRVRYQMYLPYLSGGQRCWDYWQLAELVARTGSGAAQLMPDMAKHLAGQNGELANRLWTICRHPELSQQGKIFHFIYALTPERKEFWWNGRFYPMVTDFAIAAAREPSALTLIGTVLKDRCVSAWLRGQDIKTEIRTQLLQQQAFEQWETEEAGVGASRFLMWMTARSNPAFEIDGRHITSLEQMISTFKDDGLHLLNSAQSTLHNLEFQSWLWMKGINELDTHRLYDRQEAFFALLSLCEKWCGKQWKTESRRMYLRWGDYGEITWLKEHLDWYEANDELGRSIMDKFSQVKWSEECSLAELKQKGPQMMTDYRNFVDSTEENPFNPMCGVPDEGRRFIRPDRSDGYFMMDWNGEKVTVGFLRWVGEKVNPAIVKQWCDLTGGNCEKWLEQEVNKLRPVLKEAKSGNYSDEGNMVEIICMCLWLVAVAVLFVCSLGEESVIVLNLLFAVVSAVYPVSGIIQSCDHKMRVEHRREEAAHFEKLLSRVESAQRRFFSIKKEIYSASIASGSVAISEEGKLTSFSSSGVSLPSAEMEITLTNRLLMLLCNTTLATMTGMDGLGWGLPISLALCSVIGSLCVFASYKTITQAFILSVIIQAAINVLRMIFGRWILFGLLVCYIIYAVVQNHI